MSLRRPPLARTISGSIPFDGGRGSNAEHNPPPTLLEVTVEETIDTATGQPTADGAAVDDDPNSAATAATTSASSTDLRSAPRSTRNRATTALEDAGFSVVGEVGRGSFGVVYECRYGRHQRAVAVKVVRKSDEGSSRRSRMNMKAIANEINIMAKLNHPNIVRIKKVLNSSDFAFIAMELCDGGNLAALMEARGGPVDEGEAGEIMHGIFCGLVYLHNHNIAHRDIKPQNILIQLDNAGASVDRHGSSGSGAGSTGSAHGGAAATAASSSTANAAAGRRFAGIVKITDFGLSRHFTWGRMEAECGTPHYMAPEVINRSTQYDERCDLWSAGCILYRLVVGAKPFPHRRISDLKEAVLAGAFSIPTGARVSRGGTHLIRHLILVDPNRRYTAKEAEAHPWCHGNAEAVPAPTLWEAINSFAARQRWRRAIHALIFLEALMAATGFEKAVPEQPLPAVAVDHVASLAPLNVAVDAPREGRDEDGLLAPVVVSPDRRMSLPATPTSGLVRGASDGSLASRVDGHGGHRRGERVGRHHRRRGPNGRLTRMKSDTGLEPSGGRVGRRVQVSTSRPSGAGRPKKDKRDKAKSGRSRGGRRASLQPRPSADHLAGDADGGGKVPSYMRPTKSSARKKSSAGLVGAAGGRLMGVAEEP